MRSLNASRIALVGFLSLTFLRAETPANAFDPKSDYIVPLGPDFFEEELLGAYTRSNALPLVQQTLVHPLVPLSVLSTPGNVQTSVIQRSVEVYLVLDGAKESDIGNYAKIIAQHQDSEAIKKKILTVRNGGAKQIPLKILLPNNIGSLNNVCSASMGPNCWNAVLKWYYPKTADAYVKAEEMEQILNKDFDLVPIGGTLAFGDVICYYAHDKIIHSAVYLGKNLVWHKATAKPEDPWTFEDEKQASAKLRKVFKNQLSLKIFRKKSS